MKLILKIEEAAMAAAALYFLSLHTLGLSPWIWVLLFFAPDVSMLGYVFGNKAGAISYNIFHHKGIALIIAFAGYFLNIESMLAVGILLFAHSSFDRVWGYGLKYFEGFKQTHLGVL
jgi:hypothetical protein